ncbi:MAG: hypothetical protein ACKOKB_03430, partial [Bacteroidota bacterium]
LSNIASFEKIQQYASIFNSSFSFTKEVGPGFLFLDLFEDSLGSFGIVPKIGSVCQLFLPG